MSRRSKRKARAKRKKSLSAQTLVKRGKTAFEQEDYGVAIKNFGLARQKFNAPPAALPALAESYFRRAASAPFAYTARIDLKHAVELAPHNPMYRYHLALAHHRNGDLEQAVAIYRELLAENPPFNRAAFPLAQALIQQKKAISRDPVWQSLSSAEKDHLFAAEALIRNKVTATLQKQLQKPIPSLWRGLIAFKLKNLELAAEQLQLAAEDESLHPVARGVALAWLGAADAANKQYQSALQRWKKAKSYGFRSDLLEGVTVDLANIEADTLRRAGKPQQAAELLDEYVGKRAYLRNDETTQRLNLDLAYRAAQKGNWQEALERWQTAADAGDNSRALLFNLALAYQHTNRHFEAAEAWRSLLRRRPRKATHPEAMTDQQVARIWQLVAQNYSQAGDYEEAVKTYKTAVSKSPDNLPLRIKLVEAYQEDRRWQAANNELKRILAKDPDYIPALLLLAESQSEDYWDPEIARSTLRRVLKIDPKNPVARQQLAYSYEREAERFLEWGFFGGTSRQKAAVEIYEAGLKELPGNVHLMIRLGSLYAQTGNLEQADRLLAQVTDKNPQDLKTLSEIYALWVEAAEKERSAQVLQRLKTLVPPPPGQLFLAFFKLCYDHDLPEEAEAHLNYLLQHYQSDFSVLLHTAEAFIILQKEEKAMDLLQDLLKRQPDNPEVHLNTGMLYYEQNNKKRAKEHLNRAETLARNVNDPLLAYKIKMYRDEVIHGKKVSDNPVGAILSMPPDVRRQLLKGAPPEVIDMIENNPALFKMMAGIFDEDDFDEDDFFFDEDDFYDDDDFYI